LCFGVLLTITVALLSILHRSQTDNILTIVGCLGYFCFAIGLFNTIILLSLDRLRNVLNNLVIAMLINFIIGYLISSLFGLYLAVVGLVVGGIFFAITSSQQTLRAIDRADYCYFYSGY
jgi:O-antigen/teichoic acid export membrane protein